MGQEGWTEGMRGRKRISGQDIERDTEEKRDRTCILWEGTRRSNGTGGRGRGDERTEVD